MKAFEKQVGGTHYKDMKIQPTEYCQRNGLGFCESAVVKYVSRHKSKNGRQDIEKAIHTLELLLEIEYPVEQKFEHQYPLMKEQCDKAKWLRRHDDILMDGTVLPDGWMEEKIPPPYPGTIARAEWDKKQEILHKVNR